MEEALKQRLVGAAVIIAIGIIVIPILLDGAGERQLRKIPPAPSPGMQSRPGFVVEEQIPRSSTQEDGQIVLTLPSADKDPAPPAKPVIQQSDLTVKKPETGKTEKTRPDTRKPVATSVKNSTRAKTGSSTVVKPQSVPVDNASTARTGSTSSKKSQGDAWVVQVGSFTDSKKAFRLRDSLLQKKYKVFVEKVRGRSGQHLYRVRVGPLPQREQADKLSKKLKKQGIKGYVTRHPGCHCVSCICMIFIFN